MVSSNKHLHMKQGMIGHIQIREDDYHRSVQSKT